ncbi:MAG: hypothetical protein GY772_24455, partial [bacterium]|nr:hypothetical protein [bacterium]
MAAKEAKKEEKERKRAEKEAAKEAKEAKKAAKAAAKEEKKEAKEAKKAAKEAKKLEKVAEAACATSPVLAKVGTGPPSALAEAGAATPLLVPTGMLQEDAPLVSTGACASTDPMLVATAMGPEDAPPLAPAGVGEACAVALASAGVGLGAPVTPASAGGYYIPPAELEQVMAAATPRDLEVGLRNKLQLAMHRAMQKPNVPPEVLARWADAKRDRTGQSSLLCLQEWVKDNSFGTLLVSERCDRKASTFAQEQYIWCTRADLMRDYDGWRSEEGKAHVEKLLAGAKQSRPHPQHPKDKDMRL